MEEARKLLNTWQNIVKKFHAAKKPTCLFEESDLIKRAVVTAVDKKIDRILIDDYKTFQRCKQLYNTYQKEHPVKIELYKKDIPIFEHFSVEKEIDKSLKRKIWLHSGGYLFFDRTEAMHTIDVNSGRSIQNNDLTSDLEEALVRINLEAAEEIARQLRIRNIGGLIICDFIDMRMRKNQRRVLEKLKEGMKEDSAKCTILGMSEFGLVEMTRQRKRESLAQTIFTACPYCSGNGMIKSFESVAIELERTLKKLLFHGHKKSMRIVIHPELSNYLDEKDKKNLIKIAKNMKAFIEFETKDTLHITDFLFYCSETNQEILC